MNIKSVFFCLLLILSQSLLGMDRKYFIEYKGHSIPITIKAMMFSGEFRFYLRKYIEAEDVYKKKSMVTFHVEIIDSMNVSVEDLKIFIGLLEGRFDVKSLSFGNLVKFASLADYFRATQLEDEEPITETCKTIENEGKKVIYPVTRDIFKEIIEEIFLTTEDIDYKHFIDGKGFLWDLINSLSDSVLDFELSENINIKSESLCIRNSNKVPLKDLLVFNKNIILYSFLDGKIVAFDIKKGKRIDYVDFGRRSYVNSMALISENIVALGSFSGDIYFCIFKKNKLKIIMSTKAARRLGGYIKKISKLSKDHFLVLYNSGVIDVWSSKKLKYIASVKKKELIERITLAKLTDNSFVVSDVFNSVKKYNIIGTGLDIVIEKPVLIYKEIYFGLAYNKLVPFSDDYLAIGDLNKNKVSIINWKNKKIITKRVFSEKGVGAVVNMIYVNDHLMLSNNDGKLFVWDWKDENIKYKDFYIDLKGGMNLAMMPHGKIVSIDKDNIIYISDVIELYGPFTFIQKALIKSLNVLYENRKKSKWIKSIFNKKSSINKKIMKNEVLRKAFYSLPDKVIQILIERGLIAPLKKYESEESREEDSDDED